MSNLSSEERVAAAARVAERVGAGPAGAQRPATGTTPPPVAIAPADVEKQTEEMG
jgi:hypothetical protein